MNCTRGHNTHKRGRRRPSSRRAHRSVAGHHGRLLAPCVRVCTGSAECSRFPVYFQRTQNRTRPRTYLVCKRACKCTAPARGAGRPRLPAPLPVTGAGEVKYRAALDPDQRLEFAVYKYSTGTLKQQCVSQICHRPCVRHTPWHPPWHTQARQHTVAQQLPPPFECLRSLLSIKPLWARPRRW